MGDWENYLHRIRERELLTIFGGCPDGAFENGLEIGCGDGAQSFMLARYVRRLTCTDYPRPQPATRLFGVTYLPADMEDLPFADESYDLVFSSNVLEHVSSPESALAEVRRVLRPDGLAIHVMPTVLWKLTHLLGFYPDLIRRRYRRHAGLAPLSSTSIENNPKAPRPWNRFWPVPHGAYNSHWSEFINYRRRRWLRLFESTGFQVTGVLRGPISSGYGFGLDRIRSRLEAAGLSSELIYITSVPRRSAATSSPYRDQLRSDAPLRRALQTG